MKRFELPRTPAQWLEAVMNAIFFLCGILAVGCVAVITIYMFLSGLPAIGKIGPLKFLFGTEWASTASEPKYGILPFVLSSIYGTLGASLIGVPVGLLTAVFLSKAAAPGVRNVVVTAVELLSGVPSVVFGLLGMQVLVPAVAKVFGKASGACLLSAIVVLSIMILPSIVSVSVTALNAVPPEYEQGSLALGATDTETWFKISIPAARSGIVAGIVLGIGRAIGEAMAVMMVAGNSPNMPDSLFRSVTFLTTAIAKEMSYASGLQKQALFSIVQFDLPGARVLDLYAGSGQLGIEALSRGAARCVFLDENREAVNIVMKNCKNCGVFDRSRVNIGEAARYLSACHEQFDIVLLDPPFHTGTLEKILPGVDKCLAPGGIVICESETGLVLPAEVGGMTLKKQYKYGKVLLWKYGKPRQSAGEGDAE